MYKRSHPSSTWNSWRAQRKGGGKRNKDSRISFGRWMPGLTQANLERLKGKDPVAAALASVVSSLPQSETPPTLEFKEIAKVANTKVKAWRRAARKGKGNETAMMAPMVGTTLGEEFEIPYGKCAAPAWAHSSEWEPNVISREPTPTKEPVCMEREPFSRAPEPVCVEPGLPPRMPAIKLGLDETMELLSRVLGVGEEDRHLSALSAALKATLGLSNLKKPPNTMPPGAELLTRVVKSCRGIRSSPVDTTPSPFHPRVRTVPVCSVGDTTEAEMRGYGLAALVPLATLYPSPAAGGTGDPAVPGRETKAIATANLRIKLPEFDSKNLPQWAEEFFEFLLCTVQQHADVRTKCKLMKKSCKKKFVQRQVKTAIRKSCIWRDCLKRLEQMYPRNGPQCPNRD